MAKRANGVCEFVRLADVMRWVYGDGIADVVYDLNTNPEYAKMSAFSQSMFAHAAKQKIGDAMAGPSGQTVAAKATAARETAESLTALEFNGERFDLLFEAICMAFPKTEPKTHRATLDAMDKKVRRVVENDVTVIAMMNKIRLERAKKAGISAASVLEQMFAPKPETK
jgi:hypothetical protein